MVALQITPGREVRFAQDAGAMHLAEEHLAVPPGRGPPVLDPTLQRAQLSVLEKRPDADAAAQQKASRPAAWAEVPTARDTTCSPKPDPNCYESLPAVPCPWRGPHSRVGAGSESLEAAW